MDPSYSVQRRQARVVGQIVSMLIIRRLTIRPACASFRSMNNFDPDQSFGFNLHDAARLLRRDFERRAKRHGVTRAQWSALTYIARQPGLRQGQLADLLEVTPIAVARLIDRMEHEGLVERRPDRDDRRAWQLHLTATAVARLDILREVGRSSRDLALAGISPPDQDHIIAALKRIRDNLAGGDMAAGAGHSR